jgi:drug/metabolite transporter (DMT)-like permease
MSKRAAILVSFAALYLIWGSTYLGIRFAIETIPPLLMAGTRFMLAGLIMYGVARLAGAPRPNLATWRSAAIIGGCLLLCGNGGVTLAEKWVPSGLAALLVATVPIDIALLGWLTGTTARPTPLVWLGLVGGFVGVGFLIGPAFKVPSAGKHNYFALGVSILLAGSLLWSAGSLYSRHVKSRVPLFLGAGQQMIAGGALLLLAGILRGEQHGFSLQQVSWLSLNAFIYLVLIGALLGYTAYFYLLRHCDPSKVATYAYVNPIVALLLGRTFAGERLTGRTLLGAVLIVGSVAIVIMAQQMRVRQSSSIAAAMSAGDCPDA